MGRSRTRSRTRSPRRRRSYSRSPSPEEGYRLHVSDLGVDCSKHEIEKRFEKFGKLNEVWLARNPPCFAFVVFRSRDDAEDAVRELDGTTVDGYRVRVSHARPRVRGGRGQRNNFNLRCYQCGARGHFSRDCDELRRIRLSTFRRSRSRSRDRGRYSRRSMSRSPVRRRSRSRSRSPRRERRRERSPSHERGASRDKRSRSPVRQQHSRSRSRSVSQRGNRASASPQQFQRSRSRSIRRSFSRSRSRSM